jgi:3-(3-hydroxy-phenyl)propionate hydroxylase
MIDKTRPVVIAGFGPVGAVLALALQRAGIPIVVAEEHPHIVEDQRAATMHPPTLEMLDDLAITETILPLGLISNSVRHWDRVTRQIIADLDMSVLASDTRYPFVLQYEHYKLVRLIYDRLAGKADVSIIFDCRVEALEDRGNDGVIVDLKTNVDGVSRTERIAASFVIGADGARSAVRKSAGIDFQGFTYPERFVKIMTPFDFGAEDTGYALRNFFSDPEEWCNLFKVVGDGPPGLWRVVFPARADEDEAEASAPENVQKRLRKFLPRESEYPIELISVYNVHQRVAETFRKGPAILVGDAAHLNNPIGGMGMNGGIHDAINLAQKLIDVWYGRKDDGRLDLYDRQRRTIAVNYVQAQTIRNKKMLDEQDPAVRRRNIDLLKKTAADPALARAFLRATSLMDSVEASYAIT